ncbi:TRAP transporter large permease [Pseudodesulfovibrio indicus]|uniref:C4-dicarboxylate transporter DctM subunit n=2 Tax=Pseudodesulfovibrio indicus TaxID=1716143 RepID=A0AA94PK31_9BACT|nr:TRAP transporter large permease [Pseudodesulfovibrio indicus]TDT87051.1 C4-dicarboxylate transporter DctM subunit [Pseudodesulfovibrio indicus]
MTEILLLSTLAMLLLGMPVAICLGASSLLVIILQGMPSQIAVQRFFAGVDVLPLMAIPFFILAGNLMDSGGLAKRLVSLANVFVGRVSGGLGIVTIMGCVFFAAISGSGVATAAAMGAIMIPSMVKRGYDRGFASAVVASASPIGVVIPPSISFIIYAVLTSSSVTDLYQAGIPAGMIMGLCLVVVVLTISKKQGYKGDDHPFSWSEALHAFKDASWALGTPVILIGGVFGGIFTPTESAVVAVVYALLIGLFAYRELKWTDLYRVFLDSAKMTSKIMLIISMALCFAYLLTYNQVPQAVMEMFLSFSENKYVVLMIINLLLLVAGTFMETSAILLITVPILLPVLQKFNIDLVHFGIIISANTAIGLMTPPFGVCLFTTSSIGQTSIQELSRRVIPFIGALIVAMAIITYIPQSVMFMVDLW